MVKEKIYIGRFDDRTIAEHTMNAKAKSLLGEFAFSEASGGDINHG